MFTLTRTTKVVLEAQGGICSAPCVLRQYTVLRSSSLGVFKKLNFWIWISSLHFPIRIGHRRYQKKIQLSRWSGTIPTGTPKSGSDSFISEKKIVQIVGFMVLKDFFFSLIKGPEPLLGLPVGMVPDNLESWNFSWYLLWPILMGKCKELIQIQKFYFFEHP